MSQPFRLAFLGIDNPHGAAWRELLLNFGDEVRITAILPGFDGATASLEERLSDVPRYATVDDLLTSASFDGAVVCLPNDSGPKAIAKLANAGKHILVEKPVAGSADDARQIADAVRNSGVAFQNGYMWRYDDGANRLRDMIADGRFGHLISVEATYVTSDVNRRGAKHYLFDAAISKRGFFNWLACHYLDLVFYLTGRPILGVTARTGVFGATPADVEDGGVAIIELEGGAIFTLLGGYWIPRWQGETHWCVRGSERWVHWDPTRVGTSGSLEIHGPKPQWFSLDETFDLPVDNTKGYGGRRGVALVRDWLQAAREGGRPCRNTPETTVATLELIDAIYQSSREGRRIECRLGSE